MKVGPLLFRVTATVIFLQLLLGGLLTFDFVPVLPHIITGFVVLVLAIGVLVVSLVSKPSFRPMKGFSAGLLILVIVQIALGFATLGSGSQVLAWIHFAVAMGIYGMAVAGTFIAIRWDHIARQSTTGPGNQT
jgi:hypothetical protein